MMSIEISRGWQEFALQFTGQAQKTVKMTKKNIIFVIVCLLCAGCQQKKVDLRRLLWKSPVQKFDDGCPYQVDHRDEGGHVPVAPGPRTSGLEEAIESFQACV